MDGCSSRSCILVSWSKLEACSNLLEFLVILVILELWTLGLRPHQAKKSTVLTCISEGQAYNVEARLNLHWNTMQLAGVGIGLVHVYMGDALDRVKQGYF